MLILLAGVVYWVNGLLGSHKRVDCMYELVGLDGVQFHHYSVSVAEVIEGRRDIISDGLSWVGNEFLVSSGVGQMFLNLIDVKGGVHGAYSATIIKRFDD